MTDAFFSQPILNSPYEYPGRHWELDEQGQPTQKIVEERRNPPIVEAVIDIDCDLPADIDFPSLELTAKQEYAASYPKLRKRFAELHEIITSADASISQTSTKRTLDAFQLVQEDEKQLVQVRRLGYSFNRLAPYPGLDGLLPEIRRTWELFCKLMAPRQVRRVQLRYINRILFPMADDSLELNRVLRCGPVLPDEEGLVLAGLPTFTKSVWAWADMPVITPRSSSRRRSAGPSSVRAYRPSRSLSADETRAPASTESISSRSRAKAWSTAWWASRAWATCHTSDSPKSTKCGSPPWR